jgi:transmembrane sensor
LTQSNNNTCLRQLTFFKKLSFFTVLSFLTFVFMKYMPDQEQRIAYLLDRYTNRTCTRDELDELFTLINQDDYQDLIAAAMDNTRENATVAPELDYEDIYQRIIETPRKRRALYRRPLKIAIGIAASVLLLAGAAYVWGLKMKKDPARPELAEDRTSTITPGSNKATLTLDDGSTVTLDSTGHQVIAKGIHQQNGQLVYNASNGAVHYNKLSTPRGGQFQIVLPDGTKVWLNSASTLRYPTAFNGADRTVELDGQGYFEVAPNASQLFKVKVNNIDVRVLGTAFDVMAYADESTVNTTLVNGSVQVEEGNTLEKLTPGQQAEVNNQDQSITVRTADVKKVTAWKNGLFVFNNMALPAILREVARWYDVDIVYTVQPGADLYGGGISRSLQLADVLRLLEGNGHNHFKTEGRKIIVLP